MKTATIGLPPAAPGGPLIRQGGTVGQVISDFATGQSLTAAVSAEVNKGGLKVEPAVLMVGRKITAGFIEKISIPAISEF